MQNIKDLKDLLLYHIQDMYAAEELQLKMIPSLQEKAHHSSLKNALTHHLNITNDQKARLLQIVHLLGGKPPSAKTECKGLMGLREEAEQLFANNISKEVIDAAIIASVQKIEHFEIASYGTALAYSIQLGLHKVELLLTEMLNEEYDADDLLSKLATAAINKESAPAVKETANDAVLTDEEPTSSVFVEPAERDNDESKSERTVVSPGGRAGTSHRRYGNGESRGH